jgi:hypothetical protein
MGFLDRFRKKAHEFKFTVLKVDGGSHGEHWLTIHSNPQWIIENIDDIMSNVVRRIEVETPVDGDAHQKVLGMVTPINDELQVVNQLVIDDEEQGHLKTGYPMLLRGNLVDMTIKTMRVWKVRTEAYVNSLIGDHPLTFFAADLFVNRELYLNQEVTQVQLSGMAYKVDVAPEAAAKADFSRIKGAVSTDDQSFYLKLKSAHEDDYYVYGKLTNIKPCDSSGEEGFLLTVACGPLGELPIFCLRSNMDSYPQIGQPIGANLWMVGKCGQDENL